MQKHDYERKRTQKHSYLFKIELKIVFLSDMIFIPLKECFVTIQFFSPNDNYAFYFKY